MALITGLKGGTTNITVSYGGQTATVSNFTVNKKTVTFTAPTLKSVSKYNGNEQTLINSGSCTTGGTMYYYVSTSATAPTSFSTTTWTTTVPSKKDAGTYYLWYYVYVSDTGAYTGTGINTVTKVGDGSVTIPKADNSITVTSTSATIYVHSSHTYNNTTQLSVSGAKGSVTYSSSDTGKATVNSSGLVTAKAAGTVTITATDAGTVNYNSDTATCTVTIVTDTYTDTWNNPSISKYSYSNIGAGGGTSTPTVTVTQSGTRTWTSGYSSQSLSNSTFTKSYSMTAGNGFSINTSTGVITADNRTTVTGDARSSNVATVTVTGAGSKSSTATVTCTQDANTVGAYYDTGAIDYGTPSKVTFSGSTNESRCAGGNTTMSATVTNTYHTRRDYTSGSYDNSTRTAAGSVGYEFVSRTCNDGSTATSYWGISGSTLTHRSMGTNWVTDECVVRAYNAGSSTIKGSNSDTLSASNVRSEVNITYYASCSIGDGITAAGGRATVSYSGYHTANYKYASGVTDTSLHTTEGDGASIAITSQTCAGGTNRFSLSGSTLSHSSMTTYAGTDSVTITATNSVNETGKTTASKSVTNSIIPYTIKLGKCFYPTIPASGGTSNPVIAYSQDRYYTSGSKCDTLTSGATITYVVADPIKLDPLFYNGSNGVYTYNNSGGGTVTNERKAVSGAPSGVGIEIINKGSSSPGLGGWYFAYTGTAGQSYVCTFLAKIPTGRNVQFATNSLGSGGTYAWLSTQAGTGDWTTYTMKVTFGTSPSSSFFFYLDGDFGTTSSPVTWYLGSAYLSKVTNVSTNANVNTSTGAITMGSLGTTVQNTTARSGYGIYATITLNGKTSYVAMYPEQAANKLESISITLGSPAVSKSGNDATGHPSSAHYDLVYSSSTEPTVIATYTSGSTANVTSSSTFTSSDTTVATIS